MPSFSATAQIAGQSDGYSGRTWATIRTARSRSSRGRCHEGGRAQDPGKHQTGGGRREAPDLVQVDDLEREDQPIAEEADRIPCLQEQDQSG